MRRRMLSFMMSAVLLCSTISMSAIAQEEIPVGNQAVEITQEEVTEETVQTISEEATVEETEAVVESVEEVSETEETTEISEVSENVAETSEEVAEDSEKEVAIEETTDAVEEVIEVTETTEAVEEVTEEITEVEETGEITEVVETEVYGAVSADGLWNYNLGSGGMTLTGYNGYATVVDIPTAIDGYKVSSIGGRAFMDNHTMREVTIPAGITSIGPEAFRGCIALSVINYNAKSCTVPDVYTPDGARGAGVFTGAGSASATGLTVNFGAGVTMVPDRLFMTASGTEYGKNGYAYAYVTAVNFASSVTSIGNYAFLDCKDLERVTIGKGVQTIGSYAFAGCISMKELVMGDSLVSIANNAFADCSGLESITCGKSINTFGNQAFIRCISLKELNLTAPLTQMGNEVFYGCTGLETLTLPKSLTKVGGTAFGNCSNLTTLNFNCQNLAVPEIYTPDAARGAGMFTGAGSAQGVNVIFGSGVLKVPDHLFETASQTNYGHNGRDYAHVISATFASTVTEIGSAAFYYCKDLQTIKINGGVQKIGNYAFEGCDNLQSVTFGNTVTSIGTSAFRNCSSLKSITWGTALDNIGEFAFLGCSSLETLSLPNPLTSVGNQAFNGCIGLKKLTLPKSLTRLGGSVFYGCTGLNEIIIYSPNLVVPDIYTNDANRGAGVFSGAGAASPDGLKVKFASGVTKVSDHLFEAASQTDYGHAGSDYAHVTSVTFASTVTEIGVRAFYDCRDLETIKIGSGVQKIDSLAFWRCESAKSLVMGDALTLIDTSAFSSCTSLKNITWGPSLDSIGNYAFSGCIGMEELNIPEPVTTIGIQSFENCTGLKKVTLPKTLTWIGGAAFANASMLSELNINSLNLGVPDVYAGDGNRGIGVFSGAGAGSSKGLVVTFGEGITAIPNNMFDTASQTAYGHAGYDFAHVTSVILPEGVKRIGNISFRSCKELQTMVVPSEDFTMGAGCFDEVPAPVLFKTYYGNNILLNFAKENGHKYEYLPPKAPVLSTAKVGTTGITVTWKKAMGAQGYKVLRKVSGSSTWTNLGKVTKLTYTDTTATAGKKYVYTVRPYAGSVNGENDPVGITINYLAQPKLSTPVNGLKGVKLSWGAVKGASLYRVYKKNSDGTFEKLADVTTTTYTDTAVKSGKTYTYSVRCMSKDGKVAESTYDTKGTAIKYIAAPVISGSESQKLGLSIKWNAVSGAKMYRVYRKVAGGSFTEIGDTAATDYLDKTAVTGTTYYYSIRCVSEDGTKAVSSYDTTGTAVTYTAPPVAPALFKVVGVIGGRNVTFTSADPDAVIYYSYTTSSITTKDHKVANGGTVLFTNYYGTIYAKAYVNGRWSNVSRLILKIPVVNQPTISALGDGKVKISTSTPSCQIYYTTDGTTPSPTHGTKISASSGTVTVGKGKTVKAIAVRSCFTNSDVATGRSY